MLSPRWFFFLEKWYFDVQQPDGTFLFAYFAPTTLLGRRGAEAVVCLFPPGGERVLRSFHLRGRDVRIAPDRLSADFACGGLSVSGDECRFVLRRDDVDVALTYRRLDARWTPGGDGILHRRGRQSLLWDVPLPRAEARAQGRIGARRLSLSGLGYSDLVQLDIPPWRLPMRELLWGRALSADAAVIWERPVFRQGGALVPVTRGWARLGDAPAREFSDVVPEFVQDAPDPRGLGPYPAEMRLKLAGPAGALSLHVGDTRLLMSQTVADMNELSSGLERALYRAATGDPVTFKLLSQVSVDGGPPLLAAHERVPWGRGRARP